MVGAARLDEQRQGLRQVVLSLGEGALAPQDDADQVEQRGPVCRRVPGGSPAGRAPRRAAGAPRRGGRIVADHVDPLGAGAQKQRVVAGGAARCMARSSVAACLGVPGAGLDCRTRTAPGRAPAASRSGPSSAIVAARSPLRSTCLRSRGPRPRGDRAALRSRPARWDHRAPGRRDQRVGVGAASQARQKIGVIERQHDRRSRGQADAGQRRGARSSPSRRSSIACVGHEVLGLLGMDPRRHADLAPHRAARHARVRRRDRDASRRCRRRRGAGSP